MKATKQQIKDLTAFKEWQFLMVKKAFGRCWGLQSLVIDNARGCLDELKHQSGMPMYFLTENLTEIKSL